jgi:hypothetical protein
LPYPNYDAGGRPGARSARTWSDRIANDRAGHGTAAPAQLGGGLVRRPRIAVLAAAVLTACVLAAAATPAAAGAEDGPGRALVRVAHFSPDASYVDVYMVSLNRRQLFPNVFYKSVSAYWAVAAGPFTYEVRAAGATPESRPVIQVKGNLAAGKAYTVAAVGRRDRLQGVLLRDDMAPAAPGKAKVRFLDAAYDLPSVDIAVADGPVLGSRVAFPEPTGYRQLASGSYRVEVRRSGTEAALVKGTVAVRPGTVTSVALVGGAGEPRELYAFSDAAGSRSAPAGGIRTGAGGTAPSSQAPPAPVPLAATAAVVALASLTAVGIARRWVRAHPRPGVRV